MTPDLTRRAVAVGRLMASCAKAVASVFAAIGRPRRKKPENPDPGNRRLRALAAEPIFASLPPGAVRTGWKEYPAKYWTSFFAGGSRWYEPYVALTFTSSRSVLDVHRFYAERAVGTGWTRTRALPPISTGIPWSWSKDILGKQAFAALRNNFDHSIGELEGETPRSYTLGGSIWK